MHALMKNELRFLGKALVQPCRTSRCAPGPLLCLPQPASGYLSGGTLLMNQDRLRCMCFLKEENCNYDYVAQ